VITTVSTSDGLWAAVKAAQPGDTILMAPGNYTTVNLGGMNPSSTVTITSLDPSHQAVITGINVSASSNLTFTNLEVVSKAGNNYALGIGNSTNINVDNLNIHGPATGDGNAVLIQNSTNVTVTNSNIHDIGTGISYINSDHVLISGNSLHGIQSDGMHGGGTSDITISHNTFSDFVGLGHPDAIQFWTTGATSIAHDIVISDNTMTRGTGSIFQGVFMGGDATHAFQNVTITGNAITGSMYNGIALQYANNVKVEGNLVEGYKDMTSWIYLSKVTNGSLDNNTTTSINVPNNNTNLSIHDNATIAQGAIGDTSALKNWEAAVSTTAPPQTGTISAPPPAPVAPPSNVLTAPTITGTDGNDKLTGTAGVDIIDGKGGADTMTGGAGNDTYVVDNAKDVVTEYANGGTDTVKTSLATYTLGAQVENLTLTGTTTQTGVGNELNNVMRANSVGSSLSGGLGADTLISVGGADTLTGGAGNDVFRFEALGAHSNGGNVPANLAVITDFVHGQDIVDLQSLLTNYHGDNAIADGWVKTVVNNTGTTIFVDQDGPSGPGGFTAVAKLLGITTALSSGHDWVF
jgi:parallel beta-helix repeat protein